MADSLRAHCAAGRLDVDELEHRLASALSARTIDELGILLRDLPAESRTASASAGRRTGRRRRAGLPGVRSFRYDHDLDAGRDRVFREFREHALPAMLATGYDLVTCVEAELFVFKRDDHRVVVSLSDSQATGTRLTVQGTAPRHVRKAFANIALGGATAGASLRAGRRAP